MIRKTLGALLLLVALTGAAAAQDYPTVRSSSCTASRRAERGHHRARSWATRCRKCSASRSVVEAKPGLRRLAAEAVARSDPTATRSWSFPARTRRMARFPRA